MATPHTHPVIFGRKVIGCGRCTELKNGAPAVAWAPSRADIDARRVAEIRAHDCKAARCGPVCTFGDH